MWKWYFLLIIIILFLQGCGDGDDGALPQPTPDLTNTFNANIVDPSNGNQQVTVPVRATTDTGTDVTVTNGTFNTQLNKNLFYTISLKADGYKGSLAGGYSSSADINTQIPLDSQRPSVRYINN